MGLYGTFPSGDGGHIRPQKLGIVVGKSMETSAETIAETKPLNCSSATQTVYSEHYFPYMFGVMFNKTQFTNIHLNIYIYII